MRARQAKLEQAKKKAAAEGEGEGETVEDKEEPNEEDELLVTAATTSPRGR